MNQSTIFLVIPQTTLQDTQRQFLGFWRRHGFMTAERVFRGSCQLIERNGRHEETRTPYLYRGIIYLTNRKKKRKFEPVIEVRNGSEHR